ncbi:MAG: exodeoxyribonuclease III [Sandaracinaceae bacterium]
MRIATWNINGMNARGDYLKHWLRAVTPDLVGLQELKMTDDKFPAAELEALGYRATTHGQKSWNGVAVLSRGDVEVIQRGLPTQEDAGARLLSVRQGDLTFVTVYCPNGKTVEHEDFGMKLAWYDALIGYLEAELDPNAPLVVTGDFNVVPAPIDSWNEEKLHGRIFHTEPERERIQRLLDWGLVDAWRAVHPSEPGHTWWDYREGAFHKRQGLRIDLVLVTRPVMDRVEGAHLSRDWRKKVEGLTPSDHTPVWIDLR